MTQPSAPLPSPSADDPRGVDNQRQGVHAELRRADRAITFAWIALAAQVLLTIASFALWAFEASSRPLLGVALFNAVGIIGTAVIVLLSALRRAAVVEEIEIEQTLRGGGEGASIFATDADARPADKRLQVAYRWV